MAKAKDLAALAGLAGLAYAYNKYKNKDGKDEGMTPKQNDELATANRISKLSDESDALARSNKGMSPGQSALDSTKVGVLNALGAPKAAPNDKAPNQGVLSPIPSGKSAAKAVAPTPTPTPSDRRNLESGMSRGTRPVDPRNLEAGMSRGRRMASGGMTASRRADGIATKGKTRGKIC